MYDENTLTKKIFKNLDDGTKTTEIFVNNKISEIKIIELIKSREVKKNILINSSIVPYQFKLN